MYEKSFYKNINSHIYLAAKYSPVGGLGCKNIQTRQNYLPGDFDVPRLVSNNRHPPTNNESWFFQQGATDHNKTVKWGITSS